MYTYEYSVCNNKSYMTAKVFFEVSPDVDKSFTGRPSLDYDSVSLFYFIFHSCFYKLKKKWIINLKVKWQWF